MKRSKLHHFYCRFCGSEASLPEVQDGIKMKDVSKVTCAECNHKMYEVKKNTQKSSSSIKNLKTKGL
jgi:ribosomal protein L37E